MKPCKFKSAQSHAVYVIDLDDIAHLGNAESVQQTPQGVMVGVSDKATALYTRSGAVFVVEATVDEIGEGGVMVNGQRLCGALARKAMGKGDGGGSKGAGGLILPRSPSDN